MKRRNCRGQMYLITVIIIIGLIGGLVTVMNYSRKEHVPEIYKTGEELGIEAENLLDYGTANGENSEEMKILMEDFIDRYTKYGEIEKLYFIYGKPGDITFFGYHEFETGVVNVKVGNEDEETLIIEPKRLITKGYSPIVGDEVQVISEGSTNKFTIRYGESFYFVLSQEIAEEQYVVQGGSSDDN